jgi:maleate isomerase
MDALAFRKKIGIVVPSTNNTIVGPECEALRPRGVTNHVARLTIKQ